MSHKFYVLITILFLVGACSNQPRKLNKAATVRSISDSITVVDIKYYPSFSNRAVLHFDRKTSTTVFLVDTAVQGYQELPPQWLSFPLNDTEAAPSIHRFWDEGFIRSLRDTMRHAVRDGMSVSVIYSKGSFKDSISLGNSRPKWIDSVLLEQLNYLDRVASDTTMKSCLKGIKEYIHL